MSLTNGLAPMPPMGWNSYDCYGVLVTEAEFKANADYMAAHLLPYGWEYIVIDLGWYIPEMRDYSSDRRPPVLLDDRSRLIPAASRFPSAAGGRGLKSLADYVHALGLKFGLHILRGIPQEAVERNLPLPGSSLRARDIADTENLSPWANLMYGIDLAKPGAQAYYDSIIAMYADWGADFIKGDDFTWPYQAAEIEAVYRAIEKTGRDMILSLSPGDHSDTANAGHLMRHCEMWRISSDVWDRWEQVLRQFDECRRWAEFAGPGHWPDPDMLPLGRIGIRQHPLNGPDRPTRLTPDEQRSLMTLWCIARAPLMFGGDMPSLDEFTLSLLTNEKVLSVNRNSAASRELFRKSGHIAWEASPPDSKEKYLALFNIEDGRSGAVEVNLESLALPDPCRIRDLWLQCDLGRYEGRFAPILPPHGAALYRISPIKP